MEASAKAFVEHWEWAAKKGLMNKNTASGLRAACSQVLGVLDDWETVDIRNIDVEDLLTRFQNLRKKQFKPQVLETYKRRFRQAISSYSAYLEDPGAWKPTTRKRLTQPAGNSRDTIASHEGPRDPAQEPPPAGLVEYPFPLREGQDVRLSLPRNLKRAEVKRLAAFMTTLTVDFEEGKEEGK
jgi:hypothetical protein